MSNVPDPVASVRAFNRFYTQRLGVLREGWLGSPYSLTQVRVLYELAHREASTAQQLRAELGLDHGYLSRMLKRLREQGLVAQKPSADDARSRILTLTRKGRTTFAALDRKQHDQIEAMLAPVLPSDRGRLVAAFGAASSILGASPSRTDWVLRDPASGDLGWVVHRHGALYATQYGWDLRFEGAVAKIVAQFVETFDPAKERCFLADRDGELLGSVFVVRDSPTVARLRLLLVEPRARGLGLGTRLVDECLQFARGAGYRKIVLWTNDVLVEARRIYQRAGFELVDEKPHAMWGPPLMGQTWERALER